MYLFILLTLQQVIGMRFRGRQYTLIRYGTFCLMNMTAGKLVTFVFGVLLCSSVVSTVRWIR